MDRRVTLFLVVVFLALVGYIWWNFLGRESSGGEAVTPLPTLIPFLNYEVEQVQAVEVREVKQNQVTRVVRVGDGWQMQAPQQGPADASRVRGFVFQVARVDAHRVLSDISDLATFGLNPPSYQVTLTTGDNVQRIIQIGDANPDKAYVYALRSGDPKVYLIPASVGEAVRDFVTMPPYTPTPTATPLPTPTATATAAP